ncbi:hypothetical protein ABPG72_012780 [Tetrahymena utriculariae]
MRRVYKVFFKINKVQDAILAFDVVIRQNLIFNFLIFEEVSLLLQIGFYSCVVQTVFSILNQNSIPTSNKGSIRNSYLLKFLIILLKLLQLDVKYLQLDLLGLKKCIPNDKNQINSKQYDCEKMYIWLRERRFFTTFRTMIFICEMYNRGTISFFLLIGIIYNTISLLILSYIQAQAFFFILDYDLRENLFVILELICQFVQSFLNIAYLMGSKISVKALTFYAGIYLLMYFLRTKNYLKLLHTNFSIYDQFFSGQKLLFIIPLQKRDMRQYDQISKSRINLINLIVYFAFQIFAIKYFLFDESSQPKIITVLQIKILVVHFLLLIFNIYYLKNLHQSCQSYQSEDIALAEQYRNKESQRLYIIIKSENQLYVSEEDQIVLEQMMSCHIEEFYLQFEKEFEIYSKRGNTYLKINSIRNQSEIEKVFIAALNSCNSFDFEIDKDLVSLPKLDKFMQLLLKNCIFVDEYKLVIKKEEILEYFLKRGIIDYTPYVQSFVKTCPAPIQLAAFYKYFQGQIKFKPLTILQDMNS